MDELIETNNFNLWKHCYLLYQQIKAKPRNAVSYFFSFFFFFRRQERIKTNAMAKGW